MIIWNKGEPPKDGEWYIAAIRRGESKNLDVIRICKFTWEWDNGEEYISADDIIAWSECNDPEES